MPVILAEENVMWCVRGVSVAAQHSSGPAALYSIKEGCAVSAHPPSAVSPQVPEVTKLGRHI